jgi:hypothetical protein
MVVAETGAEVEIIIAEPPPSLKRDQLERAVRSLFGEDLANMYYARWPTGVDGWLEDLVLRVRVGDASETSVMSGATLTSWQAPTAVTERLQILYGLFYRTFDGFWIDRVQDGAPRRASVLDLRVPVSDLVGWLGDPAPIWFHVGQGAAPRTTRELTAVNTPGVFRTEGGIVALAVPRGVALSDIAGEFRRFAVASDLVIGAAGMKNGGLLLLGRVRQVPFSMLPPLRFETFATFARNRAEHLAQSYERQRIFAGRVLEGRYRGWDWAPVLLSAQLDDTEFGTLLNLADQILKSWSQHGDVEYYAFRYAKPEKYPFGTLAASEYFADKFLTTSLLFNWNTEGFATITNVNGRDILTGDRSGALPILYRPADSIAKEIGLKGFDDELSIQTDADTRAREARDYFATLGDPILVRVVQNVMLCQAVQSFLVVSDPQDPPRTARSEEVIGVLEKRAAAWLAEIEAGQTDVDRRIRDSLTTFLNTSGFSRAKMARVLASPQSVEQDLQKAFESLRASRSEARYLLAYLEPSLAKADELFAAACRTVNGNIRELPGGNAECVWHSSGLFDASDSAFGQYKIYADGLQKMAYEFDHSAAEADQQYRNLQKLQQTYLEAVEVAHELSKRGGEANLDEILATVLERVARDEARASIRTPSVVLSKNTMDIAAVGGHNIDLMPRKRYLPPTSIVPPRRVTNPDQGPSVSSGLDVLEPPRPVQQTLDVKRSGSLLDEMRLAVKRGEAPPERWAELNAKAKTCQCDAVVVQGKDNIIYYVRTKPPPAQGTILGRTGVIDMLAGPPASKVVRFEGFPDTTVENIAQSTALVTAGPQGGLLDEALSGLGRLFRTDESNEWKVSLTIERAGRAPEVLRIAEQSESVALRQPVAWKGSSVLPASADTWNATFPMMSKFDPETSDAVIVRFGGPPKAVPGSLGVIVKVGAAQRTGMALRLRTLLENWISAQPRQARPLSDSLIDLRQAIKARLKPLDLQFYYKRNKDQIRAAEAIVPGVGADAWEV